MLTNRKLNHKQLILSLVLPLAYSIPFYWVMPNQYRFVLFLLGLILGSLFLVVDEYWLADYYVDQTHSKSLVSRSALFILVLIPLSFFVITSTGSVLGGGLVLGLLLGLIKAMWLQCLSRKHLQPNFLTDLQRKLNSQESLSIVAGMTGWLIFLSILVAF